MLQTVFVIIFVQQELYHVPLCRVDYKDESIKVFRKHLFQKDIDLDLYTR